MPWNHFTGLMARRLLVNWRIPLAIAQRVLPPALHPTPVNGYAIAGLCLVRLEQMRPHALPSVLGFASENLAVRMGVQWNTATGLQKSVLIFRRETASGLNSILGHYAGYGLHHRAKFQVADSLAHTNISVHGAHTAHVSARPSTDIHNGSAFESMAHAEQFFRGVECGYSPARQMGQWHGTRLILHRWDLRPMQIDAARSTLLEDLFAGTAQLDSAFIMRNIPHTWIPLGIERFGMRNAAEVDPTPQRRHAA